MRDVLLEIADLLERSEDPDPVCLADLDALVRDGCKSPLYNSEVHESELHATLYYVREGLLAQRRATPLGAAERNPLDAPLPGGD